MDDINAWLYDEEERIETVSEDEPIELPGKKSQKKKSYTVARKLEIIDYAKKVNSINSAAKKYNVDRHMIRDWRSKEAYLRRTKDSISHGAERKNLPGGGRPLLDQDFDNGLAGWVRERRAMKQKVSRTMIVARAEKMFQPTFGSEKKTFSASIGWLQKFLERHNFRARLPTTRCQKPPAEYQQKLVDFIMYLRRVRAKEKYTSIFAADETPIWLDPTQGKCIDFKGSKDVTVISTGHEKSRITVLLTARSDGQKCLPYVLLPRKRIDPKIEQKFRGKLNLAWAGKSWMNDEWTKDYLNKTFGINLFGKRLLVWDAFRCHLSEETKRELKKIKLDTAVVPGGCTKFVQAPDVCWNAPFKAKIQQLYDFWMANGEREFTARNNPRAPAVDVYLQWIYEGWQSLTKEAIASSFKTCGITNAADGSEDDEIHCFKQHGPASGGRLLLKQARENTEIDALIPEEIDIEEDAGNGYESDVSLEWNVM